MDALYQGNRQVESSPIPEEWTDSDRLHPFGSDSGGSARDQEKKRRANRDVVRLGKWTFWANLL